MKKYIGFIAILGSLIINGCTSSNAESDTGIEKRILDEGTYHESNTSNNIAVLDSQETYNNKLSEYSSTTAETLDFTKGNVILIDTYARLSYQLGFRIKDIVENNESLTLNIVYDKYKEGCAYTTVSRIPYQFVWIGSKKELLISESAEIKDCN